MSNWKTPPAPIDPALITAVEEADVVVVGLGYAGTAAVRAATEEGASVIGLEMMLRDRYTSFGRDIGHINSKFLQSRGVPAVDPIDLYNEMMRRANGRANPSLVMQFAQNCGKMFDWFTDMYGVEGLSDVHVAYWPEGAKKFKEHVGEDYSGFHFWNGTAQFPDPRAWPGHPDLPELTMKNLEKAESMGARLFFAETAVQPVMDGKRVIGIITKTRDGAYKQYYAHKGVLLAAGDFSGNREMLQELVTDIGDLLPEGKDFPATGGRKGIGHQIGVWAGGKLEPRPLPVMGGNYSNVPGFTTFGVLWLNRDGKRFTNETFGGPEISGFGTNSMPLGARYNIFDEHVYEDMQWAVPAHGGFDEHNPDAVRILREIMDNAAKNPRGGAESMEPAKKAFGSYAPTIYSGETPEELVANAGITGKAAENAVAAINRYNEICRAGRDDDFGKDPKLLRPLSGRLFLQASENQGDFGFMLVTVGGFVTDENQNVLGGDYEPIPGLYATGNCCGRRFGPAYTTPIAGVSIGMALTLGMQAGKAIAHAEK
jgi:hypothetical protein